MFVLSCIVDRSVVIFSQNEEPGGLWLWGGDPTIASQKNKRDWQKKRYFLKALDRTTYNQNICCVYSGELTF